MADPADNAQKQGMLTDSKLSKIGAAYNGASALAVKISGLYDCVPRLRAKLIDVKHSSIGTIGAFCDAASELVSNLSCLFESFPLVGVAAKIIQGVIRVIKATQKKMDAVRDAASVVIGIIELFFAIAEIARQLPHGLKGTLDPKLDDINQTLIELTKELEAYVKCPNGTIGFLIAAVAHAMSSKSTALVNTVDKLKTKVAELQTYVTTVAMGVMLKDLKKLNSMGEERIKACMELIEVRIRQTGRRGDEAERAIAGNTELLQALALEMQLSEETFRAEVDALGAALGLKLDQLDATTRAYGDKILAKQEHDKAEIIAAVKSAVSGVAIDPELLAFLSNVGVGEYASILNNAGATDLEKLTKMASAAFLEQLGLRGLTALRLEEALKNPDMYTDRPWEMALTPANTLVQLSMREPDLWPELLQSKLSNSQMTLSPDQSLEFLGHCMNLGRLPVIEAASQNLIAVIGNTGAGKSTFINFLAGCTMERVELPGKNLEKVVRVRADSAIKPLAHIGHELLSETFIPDVIPIPGAAITMVDCPGWGDNRGSEINIANAVNTRGVVAGGRSVKVVALLNYFSLLANRGSGRHEFISLLVDLFGGEDALEQHVDRIVVGVSRVPIDGDVKELASLKTFFHDPIGVDDKTASLLLKISDRMFVFDPESKEASPSWLDQKSVLDLLRTTPHVDNPRALFRTILNFKDEALLAVIVERLGGRVKSAFENGQYQSAVGDLRSLDGLVIIEHPSVFRLLKTVADRIDRIVTFKEHQTHRFASERDFDRCMHCLDQLQHLLVACEQARVSNDLVDVKRMHVRIAELRASVRQRQSEHGGLERQLERMKKESMSNLERIKILELHNMQLTELRVKSQEQVKQLQDELVMMQAQADVLSAEVERSFAAEIAAMELKASTASDADRGVFERKVEDLKAARGRKVAEAQEENDAKQGQLKELLFGQQKALRDAEEAEGQNQRRLAAEKAEAKKAEEKAAQEETRRQEAAKLAGVEEARRKLTVAKLEAEKRAVETETVEEVRSMKLRLVAAKDCRAFILAAELTKRIREVLKARSQAMVEIKAKEAEIATNDTAYEEAKKTKDFSSMKELKEHKKRLDRELNHLVSALGQEHAGRVEFRGALEPTECELRLHCASLAAMVDPEKGSPKLQELQDELAAAVESRDYIRALKLRSSKLLQLPLERELSSAETRLLSELDKAEPDFALCEHVALKEIGIFSQLQSNREALEKDVTALDEKRCTGADSIDVSSDARALVSTLRRDSDRALDADELEDAERLHDGANAAEAFARWAEEHEEALLVVSASGDFGACAEHVDELVRFPCTLEGVLAWRKRNEVMNRGDIAFKGNHFVAAISLYSGALETDGADEILMSTRSEAHLRNDDAVAALADGELCVAMKPYWAKAYSNKGAALRALGRVDDAEATYRAGLKACGSGEALEKALADVMSQKAAKKYEAKGAGKAKTAALGPDETLRSAVAHVAGQTAKVQSGGDLIEGLLEIKERGLFGDSWKIRKCEYDISTRSFKAFTTKETELWEKTTEEAWLIEESAGRLPGRFDVLFTDSSQHSFAAPQTHKFEAWVEALGIGVESPKATLPAATAQATRPATVCRAPKVSFIKTTTARSQTNSSFQPPKLAVSAAMAPSKLVALILSNLSDAALVTKALEAFRIQSFDDSRYCRGDELVGAGVHTAIVKALIANAAVPGIIEQASRALRSITLGTNGSDARSEAIVAAGAVAPLVQALAAHATKPGVIEQASYTIRILASGSDVRKEAILREGAVAPLAAAWRTHFGGAKAYASAALSELGFNDYGTKK